MNLRFFGLYLSADRAPPQGIPLTAMLVSHASPPDDVSVTAHHTEWTYPLDWLPEVLPGALTWELLELTARHAQAARAGGWDAWVRFTRRVRPAVAALWPADSGRPPQAVFGTAQPHTDQPREALRALLAAELEGFLALCARERRPEPGAAAGHYDAALRSVTWGTRIRPNPEELSKELARGFVACHAAATDDELDQLMARHYALRPRDPGAMLAALHAAYWHDAELDPRQGLGFVERFFLGATDERHRENRLFALATAAAASRRPAAKRLALAMGTHPRLGAHSPVAALEPALVRAIAGAL